MKLTLASRLANSIFYPYKRNIFGKSFLKKFSICKEWNFSNEIKEIKSESLFKSRIKVYLYNKLYAEWLWSIVYKWRIVMFWLVLTYCMWYDLDIFRSIYSAYFCSVCFSVHVLHFLYLTFGWPALMGLCPFSQPGCFFLNKCCCCVAGTRIREPIQCQTRTRVYANAA